MFGRLFGRNKSAPPDTSAWWREANALATSPDPARLAALKASVVDGATAPDAAELQEEMIDGLERALSSLKYSPLDDGCEVCHLIAPVCLIEQVDVAGKLFATAGRLVFAAGTVRQWPWHSIAAITRSERDLLIDLRGRPGAARLRTNTYGDALVIVALANRLS